MSTVAKWGSEIFVANLPSQNHLPLTTSLSNGGFVIVWQDSVFRSDGIEDRFISYQMVNPDGSLLGIEKSFGLKYDGGYGVFYAGNVTPSVSSFLLGGEAFSIAWAYVHSFQYGYEVQVQDFSSQGVPLGDDRLVSTLTPMQPFAYHEQEDVPSVAILSDGREAVAWLHTTNTGRTSADAVSVIQVQLFNADGSKNGDPINVNNPAYPAFDQVRITGLTNGGFVVTWQENVWENSYLDRDVRAQVFSNTGAKSGSDFVVSSSAEGHQVVPEIAALSNGGFVVVWEGANGNWPGIGGQVFNADGSRSGVGFSVIDKPAGPYGYQQAPTVAALADGRFVVVWHDRAGNFAADENAIRGRVFNADGSSSGDVFDVMVNLYGSDYGDSPSVSGLADGRFTVTWRERAPGGGENSIRAQVFDPREQAIDIAGISADEFFAGTLYADVFQGNEGKDSIDGSAGNDRAEYLEKTSSISVVLNGSEWVDVLLGGVAEDRIRNIESVTGGSGNDTLTGDALANELQGGGGNDALDGGIGVDTASYTDKTASVQVTLNGSTWANVLVAGVVEDTVRNIENLVGGAGGDQLTGDDLANELSGGGGDDALRGNAGNDALDGGEGSDTASFEDKTTAVQLALNGSEWVDVLIGGVAEDRVRNIENVTGGTDNDTLTGDGLANALSGNAGNDTLQGQGGNDALDGGIGIDTASYADKTAAVQVTLNGSTWANVLVAGVVEDTIRNIENLVGGAGGDQLTGDDLANELSGGGGDDALRGNAGNDALDGGEGSDTASFEDKTTAVQLALNGSEWVDVLVGGVAEDRVRNIENVTGGTDSDTLTGDGLANALRGNAGNDTLQGQGGNDALDGGIGIDTASYADKTAAVQVTLNGSTWANVLVAGVVEDTVRNIENLVGGSGSDFFFGDALANAFSGGAGIDVLLGQGGNDRILGGEGVDYLYGGDNDDQLEGENGGDALFGDAGNDILLGGASADYIDGGTGNDYADGGDANDIFLMGADNDTVLGQAGNDYADLSGGDDYADGGAGEDILLGGLGNDVLLGGADADYIDAGDGFDYADGGEGNDIFLMGAGNDTAVSQGGIDFFDMGEGDDTATGGAGNDIFLGGAGNDTFDAGAGVDVALGAGGNDSYLVRSTSGLLLVYDFAASGAGDVLRLTADTGIASFAQAQAKLSFNASVYASVLTVDADTSVWLVGVTNAQLTAADFAFG